LSFNSTGGSDRSVLIDNIQIKPLANARIAHWKLDETSGLTAFDSAGVYNGQLGTAPANPTINQPGQFATAYGFNSAEDDRVDLSAHIANFSSLRNGTITGWFNSDTADRGALLNFGEATTADRMVLEMENGNIRFLIREAASTITNLETAASFNDGTWHHFAVTNDDTTTSLLIDGVLVPLSNTTDSASWFDDITGADSFTLGYEIRSNAELPFNGFLDDIAIYDHVLTSEQLSNVINLGAEYFLGQAAAIPEPSTFALAFLGLMGMAWFGWRRK